MNYERRELLTRTTNPKSSDADLISQSSHFALREATEAISIGQETLNALAEQEEILERSDMIMDSHQYLIERSNWHLRGMTFWGRIQNAFSKPPVAKRQEVTAPRPANSHGPNSNVRARAATLAAGEVLEGFLCPECLQRCRSAQALSDHFERHHEAPSGMPHLARSRPRSAVPNDSTTNENYRLELLGSKATNQTSSLESKGLQRKANGDISDEVFDQYMQQSQAYLDNLAPALDDLKNISGTINEALGNQNRQIDQLKEKTDCLDDRTRRVTRKAMKVKGSNKAVYKCEMAFQEITSKLFVSVEGDDLVLREQTMKNVCRFGAYHKNASIWGLKSSISDLWVGQNMFGQLKVRGKRFKDWEELDFHIQRGHLRIKVCSAAFGKGGWVYVNGDGSLGVGDSSKQSRDRASVFKIINCNEYIITPFAQDQLLPPTEALVNNGIDGIDL